MSSSFSSHLVPCINWPTHHPLNLTVSQFPQLSKWGGAVQSPLQRLRDLQARSPKHDSWATVLSFPVTLTTQCQGIYCSLSGFCFSAYSHGWTDNFYWLTHCIPTNVPCHLVLRSWAQCPEKFECNMKWCMWEREFLPHLCMFSVCDSELWRLADS